MPITARVQRCVVILMLVFKLWQRAGAADTVKCKPLTCAGISVPEQSSVATLSSAISAQCEVMQQKNSIKTAGSKHRLKSMLLQEKRWNTDAVGLVFDYPTVSRHLRALTLTLGRLIAFDG